ncbi:hypothetical protein Cni_G19814 [Canna indica]|uniref:Reverse transcriptase domain-containing protein n=1 Tax=Canna indica TaxID=4628 RepID=A0AAQ3QIZ2_9LILI|nr:hypothetical protein Cni_G19814 [Canna indica]
MQPRFLRVALGPAEALSFEIANSLGNLISINSLSFEFNRGKYIRVCIEVDLSQPIKNWHDSSFTSNDAYGGLLLVWNAAMVKTEIIFSNHDLWPVFPTIPTSMKENIIKPFTKEKLWSTVKTMANGKSPGVDGFTAEFYKSYWPIIEQDFFDCITNFQNTSYLPFSWNQTVLTFIPKVSNPSRVKDYRPISLCNLNCHILSKLLANRLKETLPIIISKEQSAFIKGRSIHENVLIAQEAAHSIFKSKEKHPYIMIKLDLAKAFDSVSWQAIYIILEVCNFPPSSLNGSTPAYPLPPFHALPMASSLVSFKPIRVLDKEISFPLSYTL